MPANTHYITDNRILPDAISQACTKRDVAITSYSDAWILKLQKGDRIEWIHAYSFSCNTAAAAANAADKVATYQILNNAGIPAVPHLIASTYALPVQNLKEFVNLDMITGVVIKPLSGHGALEVHRFDELDDAVVYIINSPITAWAVSPYVEIEKEIRIIFFGGNPVLAYEKRNPFVLNGLKLFNLSHGARADTIPNEEIDNHLLQLASRAVQSLSLTLAAVDVIIDDRGDASVLEVNTGFSLEHYARQSESNKQRAYEIYDSVIEEMFR